MFPSNACLHNFNLLPTGKLLQVVESLSLEILKRHLGTVLGNQLCVALPEQGGWTR